MAERPRVPEDMTPAKLRYVARSLDLMTRILPDPLNWMVEGKPVSDEAAEQVREWLSGTEQQDDLCRWANEIEAELS